jgi:hypothetical protein
MLGMGYLLFAYLFPTFMGIAPRDPRSFERISAVEGSGPRAVAFRGGGIIGTVSMTAPFLAVSAYPAGLVLKALFIPQFAIRASEIRRVTATRPFLSSRLVIEHSAVDVPSPVILYARPESAIGRAITALVPVDGVATVEAGAARADNTRVRRFETITGWVNVAMGAGAIVFGLVRLASDHTFGSIVIVIGLIFLITGARRLQRTAG